jgi:hypothetical protein
MTKIDREISHSNFCPTTNLFPSGTILDQLHETVVHMELHMTVQQRIAWIVRNKIDDHGLHRHYVDYILVETTHFGLPDTCHLK